MKVEPAVRWALGLGMAFCVGAPAPVEGAVSESERVTIAIATPKRLVGTYRVFDRTVLFDVTVGADQKLIFRSKGGAERMRVEAGPAGAWMWHDGVALDLNAAKGQRPPSLEEIERRPELARWVGWLATDEARLIASLWRDLNESPVSHLAPAQALIRYSIHLDEARTMLSESRTDVKALHRCDDCFGKCGPGCWSVGHTSYCAFHDCCCDHYGWFSCLTWCWVNPACPDCDQQVCGADTPALCGGGYTSCPNGSPCGNCGWECEAAQGG
jgi:hypothetical protein